MGKIMSTRNIGSIIALVIAGYVYDSFPACVPYALSLLCFTIGTSAIIIPWCYEFWIVAIMLFVQYGAQHSMNNGNKHLLIILYII